MVDQKNEKGTRKNFATHADSRSQVSCLAIEILACCIVHDLKLVGLQTHLCAWLQNVCSGYRVNRKLKAVLLNMPSIQVGCITTCGPLEWPYFWAEWIFHKIWSFSDFSGQVMEGSARPKHADDLFEEDKARWIQPGSIVGLWPWLVGSSITIVEQGNCMQLFKKVEYFHAGV